MKTYKVTIKEKGVVKTATENVSYEEALKVFSKEKNRIIAEYHIDMSAIGSQYYLFAEAAYFNKSDNCSFISGTDADDIILKIS